MPVSIYSLSPLPDSALLRDLASLIARERVTTAALLAHLAEVDARKLYLPAAHPSIFSYCVGELRLSEDVAYKRIQAARTAREFPAIFAALADGRLHLTGVLMLAPHLAPDKAAELLAAASHQSKAGIERLLAERFPRPDLLPRLEAIGPSPSAGQLAPERVASHGTSVPQPVLGQADASLPRPKLAPLAPQRFALEVTIGEDTHKKLRYAQALLGHQVPSGDLAQVLDRAFDALIGQLERRKFAATTRPRSHPRRPSANARHIPAEVKRAVWERDGGRCTFVTETGQRCPARSRLEFDHTQEVARGGRATVAEIRLRCRAHNQYQAECTFGTAFMRHKREEARRAAAATRARAALGPQVDDDAHAAADAREQARQDVFQG
jgi:hypothetical protein